MRRVAAGPVGFLTLARNGGERRCIGRHSRMLRCMIHSTVARRRCSSGNRWHHTHTDADDRTAREERHQHEEGKEPKYDSAEAEQKDEDNKKMRYPVVLCHGLMGFDKVQLGWMQMEYWRGGIVTGLQKHAHEVYVARVSPTADVSIRAMQLKQQVQTLLASVKGIDGRPYSKVNLLGHSMGGLDARYLVSKLGGHELVSSVTTLASPHRGSSFADWSIKHFGPATERFLRILRIPTEAFLNLTTGYMEKEFNPTVLDHPAVEYYSFAAAKERSVVHPVLRFPFDIIYEKEGDNDILVSATWGKHVETVGFDHFEQINLSMPFLVQPRADTHKLYSKIANTLAEHGH